MGDGCGLRSLGTEGDNPARCRREEAEPQSDVRAGGEYLCSDGRPVEPWLRGEKRELEVERGVAQVFDFWVSVDSNSAGEDAVVGFNGERTQLAVPEQG